MAAGEAFDENIQLFEDQPIKTVWDGNIEECFFLWLMWLER